MNKTVFFILALALGLTAAGQSYTFVDYQEAVLRGNLDLAAERLNVDVAQADVSAAKIKQDPSVSVGYDNNSDWAIAMGQACSVEISKPISLGKVSARSQVARHMLGASEASLLHYLNNLKADASLAFLEALLARDKAELTKQTYDYMRTLYEGDCLRLEKGDISPLDVMQSQLETVLAQQEWQAAVTDYANARLVLDNLAGQPARGTVSVEGQLSAITQVFDLPTLVSQAVSNRPDVVAALRESDASESQVVLTRRERMPDFELSAAVGYNTRVRNEEAPAPQFVGYSVGLSVPLPLSTFNRAEVRSSALQAQQAQIHVQSVQAAVRTEVMQAYNSYEAARLRVEDYSSLLLSQSQQVLDGKLYAYRRGETSLLDLLNAQHTYNQVRQAYAEILHDCMSAYVELMRACGISDYTLGI